MTFRAVAALIVSLAITNQGPPPSEGDWRWLDASREQAFDELLPVAVRKGQIVAYRSYRDLYQDVLERYLRVERASGPSTGGDAFVATVVAPVGRSIQQQLLEVHRARPDPGLNSVLADVALRRIIVSSKECAALTASLDALSGVTVVIPKRDVIVLHPTVHRFAINVGTASIDVTLFDNSAPLVRWFGEAIAAIERCAAQQANGVDATLNDDAARLIRRTLGKKLEHICSLHQPDAARQNPASH
jgi:hypothetical protein